MSEHFIRGTASALPINLLGQATRWLSRAEQEDLIERLISYIDSQDGDPDLEDDDPSGQCDEDGINTHGQGLQVPGFYGVGCPISDPDMCLAGDDGIFSGPAVVADALGFSSRPNRYAVGMTEDIEPPSPAETPISGV